MSKAKHFAFFILAGGTAFGVNVAVLFVYAQVFDGNPYIGQIFGLWSSITASWWINRTWTFKRDDKMTWKEYGTYCLSMLFSSLVNYGCYALTLQIDPVFLTYPTLALFPATAISMVVSYVGMKFFVFKKTD